VITDKTLRIKESEKPGIYRFWIDGVDVSNRIQRAEMLLSYGHGVEEGKRTRIIIGADVLLPERYQMTVHKGKPNGSISTSDANDR
jgi:hypothetical protein